jgi:hypothetical protein
MVDESTAVTGTLDFGDIEVDAKTAKVLIHSKEVSSENPFRHRRDVANDLIDFSITREANKIWMVLKEKLEKVIGIGGVHKDGQPRLGSLNVEEAGLCDDQINGASIDQSCRPLLVA